MLKIQRWSFLVVLGLSGIHAQDTCWFERDPVSSEGQPARDEKGTAKSLVWRLCADPNYP